MQCPKSPSFCVIENRREVKALTKRVLALTMLVIIVFSMSATAITSRSTEIRPLLSFEGTTAICSVPIFAERNGEISIVVKLWQGKTVIKTWRDDGVGTLLFEEKETVTKGKTYGLSADVTINGEPYPCGVYVATCK